MPYPFYSKLSSVDKNDFCQNLTFSWPAGPGLFVCRSCSLAGFWGTLFEVFSALGGGTLGFPWQGFRAEIPLPISDSQAQVPGPRAEAQSCAPPWPENCGRSSGKFGRAGQGGQRRNRSAGFGQEVKAGGTFVMGRTLDMAAVRTSIPSASAAHPPLFLPPG